MSMTRQELRQRIVRNLGGGMIKTELCVEHLDDAINTARDLWITWAVGSATMEVYFLLMLKAGENVYDMPAGLVEVVGYQDKMGGMGAMGESSFGGYGQGRWYTGPEQGSTAFFALGEGGWSGIGYGNTGANLYTMVDAYLALSHVELIKKMRHDKYQWRYHKFTNKLEIVPTPMCGSSLTVGVPAEIIPDPNDPSMEIVPCPGEFESYEQVDSPGFVMIRGFMMEGASLPTYTPSAPAVDDPDNTTLYPAVDENYLEYIFSHPWIINYSTAHAKEVLGLVRRKFANNSALGGASVSLDGDALVSEGREDKQRLEEELDLKYSSEGYGIIMG